MTPYHPVPLDISGVTMPDGLRDLVEQLVESTVRAILGCGYEISRPDQLDRVTRDDD